VKVWSVLLCLRVRVTVASDVASGMLVWIGSIESAG